MLENKEEVKFWKKNWFVKNVLAEMPIFGAFFKQKSTSEAIHHASKHTAMLLGGSAGMVLQMLISENMSHDNGNMSTSMPTSMSVNEAWTKTMIGTGYMALGMMGGNIAYNTLFSVGKKIYKNCEAKKTDHNEESHYGAVKLN